MAEDAVAMEEKSVEQLMEELGEAFRDIAEGRYDTDPDVIRERIERMRERR